MKSFKQFITEAVKKGVIKKSLDSANIDYKSIKEPTSGEFEIESGMASQSGKKWDDYQDSVYKALKAGGVDLSGDASVFIN